MTRPTKPREPAAKKGRTKKTIIEEILPAGSGDEPEGPTELDFNLEEVRDTEKLFEVLEQFPDAGITVKIYDQSGAYRFTPPDPQHIDEELIRKRCGSGAFVGRVYVDGKYRQSIDIPIGEVNPDPNEPSKPVAVDNHSQFLEKMLLTLLARENPAPAAHVPSITELVTSLAGIDALRGKQESGMEMFIKGMTMGRDMSDSGGDFNWKQELFRLISTNAPALLTGVEAIVGGRLPTTPPPPTTPPATIPNPEPQEQPVNAEMYYKEGISYVKQRLLAGMDPDTIINWVYDNRDVPTYQPFLTVILREPFEFFEKIDAEIGQEPFRSKFMAIHNGIRSLFNEEYEMGLDTGRDGGDTGNPGSNGKPKPSGVQ